MGLWSTLLFAMLMASCSAGGPGSATPGNQTGQCSLNCSNAIIAGSDAAFSIVPIFETVDYICGESDVYAPIQVQWRVRQKFKVGENEEFRPVPFVSFNVSSAGLREVEGDQVVNKITTSEDLRCSDSCGVMTVDLNPTCPAVGKSRKIALTAHSGSLFPENTVSITLSKE